MRSLNTTAVCLLRDLVRQNQVLPHLTGEGMLEHEPDRHEQLKLQAQKQALLEGNSCVASPTSCDIGTAEISDEQEDLDALMY